MKQKYHIDKEWDGYHNETISFDGYIEIDDDVINSIDDEWREMFYDLTTHQEIAEHIAFNIIVNNAGLSRLDGFANFPDEFANICKEDV
ncbi:MAG: hypothetical protein KAJ93_01190 [Methanosarcinales archaeon]|nr:hypothetical protein [Methanosarcinales archaeon]